MEDEDCAASEATARPTSGEPNKGVRAHVPVMVAPILQLLKPLTLTTVIDGTFGAGGHAHAIAATMPAAARYIAVDRDPTARLAFERFAADFPRLATTFINAPFVEAFTQLTDAGTSADAAILDLGVSSMQLDQTARGFSYARDAPLDMRMDQSRGETAADILATRDVGQLTQILRDYGDERFARAIAKRVVATRDAAPLHTTSQLVALIRSTIPQKVQRTGTGHPAKRTFQALRIAVNDELGMIDRGLDAARAAIRPGGRIIVMSFQSLEDRIVKRRFTAWSVTCTCPPGLPECVCGTRPKARPLTKRPILADAAEISANPRATSAKLRAVEVFDDTAEAA